MIPNTGLPNTERRRRVTGYLRQGMAVGDIARIEGVSHQHVYRLIKQMKLVKETRYKEQAR